MEETDNNNLNNNSFVILQSNYLIKIYILYRYSTIDKSV